MGILTRIVRQDRLQIDRKRFLELFSPFFSMVAIQGFDGVAVDHSHNSSGVVGGLDKSWDEQGCQQ
jgi:hypothetical protein